MDITILYEDKDILAIDKPAGIVVHPNGKTVEYTLIDWILKHYPATKGVGEPTKLADGTMIDRPGIVHRIDKETSGVLLIAKTAEAHAHLKAQFQARTVAKEYNTFVYGNLKDDDGLIDRPIGRSSSDFRKWSAQRGARGELRDAVTHFKVLRHGKEFTFVEANPRTGRTHQIRVHFKAINHPVVSDGLYAENHPKALGFERLALHAKSIEFDAMDGKRVKVEAPLPPDFVRALELMEKMEA